MPSVCLNSNTLRSSSPLSGRPAASPSTRPAWSRTRHPKLKGLCQGFTHKLSSVQNWISVPGELCTVPGALRLGTRDRKTGTGVPHAGLLTMHAHRCAGAQESLVSSGLAVVLSGKRAVTRPALPCLDRGLGAAVRVHVLGGERCPAPVVVPVTLLRRRRRRRGSSSCCYSGPLTASSSRLDSILPSSVQTAPVALQPVVTGRTTLTPAFPSGSTVISQRMLLGLSSRRAFFTVPRISAIGQLYPHCRLGCLAQVILG